MAGCVFYTYTFFCSASLQCKKRMIYLFGSDLLLEPNCQSEPEGYSNLIFQF